MKRSLLLGLLLCLFALGAAAQTYTVTIVTNRGTIKMKLYDGTPQHRDNMVRLVRQHFYDSTLFHRVIAGFVIQGGDPDSKRAAGDKVLGEGEYGDRVPAEILPEYYHKRGALGMARDDNPQKASSGCQFYIVVGKPFTEDQITAAASRNGRTITAEQREVYKTQGGTPHLDGNYTVFGEVTEGMEVVDRIAGEAVRSPDNRPTTDIRMLKVTVRKKKRFLLF